MWQSTLLLICLTLLSSRAPAQAPARDSHWPPGDWADTSRYFVHTRGGWTSTRTLYGTVVLKNGDTLGQCYVRPWYYYCKILRHNSFEETTIQNKDIRYIRAQTPFSKAWVEFSPIYKNPMWRLIGQKGSAAIYDFSDSLNLRALGSPMLLVTGGKITRIYGSLTFPSLTSKYDQMLKFINRRYQTTLKKSDFPTIQNMIDYILDKEAHGPSPAANPAHPPAP